MFISYLINLRRCLRVTQSRGSGIVQGGEPQEMKKGYLYILFATILFSSMETVLKLIAGQFNPIQLTFMRFLIGSIVLSPLAIKSIKTRRFTLRLADIKLFMLTGFVCVVVSMSLYQMAIINTQASIVAVLFSCNPVFVIPLAHFMLREKIYKYTLVSMVVSIIGMIWIMNPLKMTSSVTGIILTLLAAATFSVYSVIGKAKSAQYGAVVLSCFSFLMGSLEMLALILISRISAVAAFLTHVGLKVFANIPLTQGLVWPNIPGLMYIGICVTGMGFMFYFLALEETSVSTGALVFYIKPALAPIFALVFLRESITSNVWIGILLILVGSCITFFPNTTRAREAASLSFAAVPVDSPNRK
jgi:drug/metabolite transporter (DMT)-like permease